MKGIDIFKAEKAVEEVIYELNSKPTGGEEIEKVKNKFESSTVFSNTSILNKAMNLAYYELLGDAALINKEVENYRSISPGMLKEAAGKYFSPANCSTLYYISTRNN